MSAIEAFVAASSATKVQPRVDFRFLAANSAAELQASVRGRWQVQGLGEGRVPAERREVQRHRMVLPVTYRWKSGDASFGEAAGFTHDISIGGMFIVADRLPRGDTDVWCEVVLPQSFDRGVMRKLRVAGPVEIREFSGVEEHPSGFAVRGRPALLTEEGKPEDWERLLTGVLK